MKNYLLALDGSENSSRAAKFLSEFTHNDDQSLITVIHVVNSKKEIYKFSPFADIKDIKQAIMEQGEKLIAEQLMAFENITAKVKKVILDGDAGPEISRHADHNSFDVIVMGSRGLSDLEGLVLGSVSHKVLHLASCPVILVK